MRLQRPEGPDAPSGTLIRSDVHRYREMLSAEVYRSFVFRICLLGGESTGKSTLSRALAAALNAPYVAEFGREYWEEKNGVLECDDLLHIAREQVRREDAASTAPYLICDTSPLTVPGKARRFAAGSSRGISLNWRAETSRIYASQGRRLSVSNKFVGISRNGFHNLLDLLLLPVYC